MHDRVHLSRLSRRRFVAALATLPFPTSFAGELPGAGRKLDFHIADGFGDADADDLRAVLRSTAESIWRHCPGTRWEVPGFFIFHTSDAPITVYAHRRDGRIAIGLTPQGNYWNLFAFEFAHEFCHALATHTNDWRQCWREGRRANNWIEESLCETASLFALRSLGRGWQEQAPYPNWKSYAPALTKYAQARLEETAGRLPKDFRFEQWFAGKEAAMRQNAVLRAENRIVARELLPLFEATPAGWEAITFLNRTRNRAPEKSLSEHFADWKAAAPEPQRAFIARIAGVFGR